MTNMYSGQGVHMSPEERRIQSIAETYRPNPVMDRLIERINAGEPVNLSPGLRIAVGHYRAAKACATGDNR